VARLAVESYGVVLTTLWRSPKHQTPSVTTLPPLLPLLTLSLQLLLLRLLLLVVVELVVVVVPPSLRRLIALQRQLWV